jgi:hypothetical protein
MAEYLREFDAPNREKTKREKRLEKVVPAQETYHKWLGLVNEAGVALKGPRQQNTLRRKTNAELPAVV